MTQEEKAKAYDEAIKVARSKIKNDKNHVLYEEDIIDIFHELKENEDERIRKALITYFKMFPYGSIGDAGTNVNEAIDWLEKQGKHLEDCEAEKEKADFVGDGFIECRADFLDFKEGITYWLEYVGNDNYNVRSDNLLGKTYHITPCQLYTIFKKLTWLEKQCSKQETLCNKCKKEHPSLSCREMIELGRCTVEHEQKPTDKAEPKFKVGDWIVFNGLVLHIDENVDGYYRTTSIGGIPNSYDWDIDNIARLWTFEDAKNGDVLSFYSEYKGNKMVQVGIIEKYVGKHGGCSNTFKIYVGVNWENNLQIGEYMGCSDIRPASKGQRDILFAKIKEAIYEWDAEKKELKTSLKA